MYPKIVMEHFLNPRNVGKIDMPTSQGEYITSSGGKAIFYIKEKNGIIAEVKYQVAGCPFAIAVCSIISEYVKEKTISFVKELNSEFLKTYFEFSKEQEECINLALFAFKDAVRKL